MWVTHLLPRVEPTLHQLGMLISLLIATATAAAAAAEEWAWSAKRPQVRVCLFLPREYVLVNQPQYSYSHVSISPHRRGHTILDCFWHRAYQDSCSQWEAIGWHRFRGWIPRICEDGRWEQRWLLQLLLWRRGNVQHHIDRLVHLSSCIFVSFLWICEIGLLINMLLNVC